MLFHLVRKIRCNDYILFLSVSETISLIDNLEYRLGVDILLYSYQTLAQLFSLVWLSDYLF